MADFPEDGVEIFPGYIPRRRGRIAAALEEIIPDRAVDPVHNDTAVEVDRARREFARLLRHPSMEEAIARLGLAGDEDGVYQLMLVKREFGNAQSALDAVVLDTTVPRVSVDRMRTALTTSPITYFEERPHPNAPEGADPEVILIRRVLPGYAGRAVSDAELGDLVVLAELVRGGAEREWRIGLLQAECEVGRRRFRRAVRHYDRLLADPDSGPTKRRFLALRLAAAQVARGDVAFRAGRFPSADDLAGIRAVYEAAIAVLDQHAVSAAHPTRQHLARYARLQLDKIDARLNVLGLRDSMVPVGRFTFLRQQAREHIDQAADALDRFERYREKANQLDDLADEVDAELVSARSARTVAELRLTNAGTRIDHVENQIEALRDRRGSLLAETGLGAVGALSSAVSGDVVGLVSFAVKTRSQFAELGHQETSAALDLEIAQRDEQIAGVEKDNAQARVDYLAEKAAIVADRRLSQELYYALAGRFEDLAEEQVALAARHAYLYERAVAFFLGLPGLAEIRFDYRGSNGELLGAPNQLRADLQRVTNRFTEAAEKQDDFTAQFSLRADYPIEFARFQQGELLEFVISLYELEKRFPGTHQVRIVDVEVVISGLVPPTGFDGTLTHMGRFLLRDRASTMDDAVQRLVPTDAELTDAVASQQQGNPQAAVGGVIPYALDPDTAQLNSAPTVVGEGGTQEFLVRLFEGYGPTGLWRLALGAGNRRLITDIELHFTLRTAETDVFAFQEKITDLVARYERELVGDAKLDRIKGIGLRRRFPDAFDELAGGTTTITLGEEDFQLGDARVTGLVLQALDVDGVGVGELRLEFSRPGTPLRRSRVTGADGFSEDLSAGPPETFPAVDRVPGPGPWRLQVPDPATFAAVDELQLFFVYTAGSG